MSFSTDDFAQALSAHDYAFEVGQTVRGTPINHDNDGVYVDIGGKATAFLPRSEYSRTTTADVEATLPLHEERDFLIIRGQDADGQVLLSIKRLEWQALWDRLLAMQAENQSLQVRVNGLNKGGVTVDVEGLRGFIPRSHLLERDHLESLQGQLLTVTFLEVDPERKKLVLSNRNAMRSTRIGALEIGEVVSGTIRDIKPFGAFVDLQGVTGLLHIKQVSQTFIPNLADVLNIGTEIKALVLDLDPGRGRISLSTKVLENRPGELLDNFEGVMAEADVRAHRYRDKLQQQPE